GDNNNLSWNHGVEGPTEDPKINALRERQRRNFLTTLLISQGVPMLLGGDEFGRTQNGNNNAYCQDNELSWFHWEKWDENQKALFEFTRRLIPLRHQHPVFLLPGQENIEWQLLLDTATESGFLAEPKSFPSGDELPVIDRGVCLLKLSAGAQAQARQESFRKRPFDFPHAAPQPVPEKKE